MTFSKNLISFLDYFPKGEVNQLSISITIRNFALGLITIFIPIYIYQYFHSLPLTLLFFAISKGLFGLLVPFGGQLMTKIGVKHALMLSSPFIWGFYFCLFLFEKSFLLIPLAIIFLS